MSQDNYPLSTEPAQMKQDKILKHPQTIRELAHAVAIILGQPSSMMETKLETLIDLYMDVQVAEARLQEARKWYKERWGQYPESFHGPIEGYTDEFREDHGYLASLVAGREKLEDMK